MSHYVWIAPLVALALAQVAVIATSIYLHRGLAHRSIRVTPALDVCFRAVLWITTGQSRREWVAVHRKHHAFTDRPGDPHSPRLELGSHGHLIVDQRFSRAPFPAEESFVAQGTLHTNRGQRVARVEVEVGAWSNDATVLTLRPVARNPQRWSGRRATRYFELAHEGADAIARLAEAS